MADQSYDVEVQNDFIERITKASPVQAIAELIWNSLDADAKKVRVLFEYRALGGLDKIIVEDNGTGINFAEAPTLFRFLGGSWKSMTDGRTTKEHRFLHGQEGRGRFKALALGNDAEWDSNYEKNGERRSFKIRMAAGNLKKVTITAEHPAENGTGTVVTIRDLNKTYEMLQNDGAMQDLTEIFAVYLNWYKHVTIDYDGNKLDPVQFITSQTTVELTPFADGEEPVPVSLDIIEWNKTTTRALYLSNDKGFPLSQVMDRRFHVGTFQFTAYLKSDYIAKLHKDDRLELAQMNPTMMKTIDEAQDAIRKYFQERAAQEAGIVVEEWKQEQIYPYKGDATTTVEEVERKVFDIVAVNVAQHLPEFSTTPKRQRAFHLRMLRQAIEKSPEDLQLILEEVLNLPKRKQEELADLLRNTTLQAIISAANIVAGRLKFLAGLEVILFDAGPKERLKERSQLHQIIAEHAWLFGEEFSLSVSDRSLTEVLRKHKQLLGEDLVIDEPVMVISQKRGIVDLMLSRVTKRHPSNGVEHLVVELKAPKVKIDGNEVLQIEKYAFAIKDDERFRNVRTNWVFWVISDDFGDYVTNRMKNFTGEDGKIYQADDCVIYVKTWGQVLAENKLRLQFFQEKLEYAADKGAALRHLQERHAQFLSGVLIEEDETIEVNTAEVATKRSKAKKG
jgi:hypothetical protein